MAFEGLSEKLGKVFKNLRNRGKLTEKDVREAMREVKTALIEADVNYKITKEFVAKVTERAVGAKITESLTPDQQVIDIVHEELILLLGNPEKYYAEQDNENSESFSEIKQKFDPEKAENIWLNFPSKPPCVIMMCGLQGAGKTTHTGKLAKYLKGIGKRPLLVACDIYRPAAIEQLKIVGEKCNVNVFEMGQTNPVEIAEKSIKHAKDYAFDVVILDTAGRLHIDDQLMNELKEIKAVVNPHEILLVVDSMTGQDATLVSKTFNELLSITGVVLTKLDGDTRGGAAISIFAVTGKPVKFVGVGEKPDDLEVFYPDRMASRILGMGDMLSFIEKAKSTASEREQEKLANKIFENKFDMNDLYAQLLQIEKMGSIASIVNMIPGFSGKLKEGDIDESRMPKTKAIISSMTHKERENPEIINAKRKKRIAAGSGTKVEDVNNLLKQFEGMSQVVKKVGGIFGKKNKNSFKRKQMLRNLGNMLPGGISDDLL